MVDFYFMKKEVCHTTHALQTQILINCKLYEMGSDSRVRVPSTLNFDPDVTTLIGEWSHTALTGVEDQLKQSLKDVHNMHEVLSAYFRTPPPPIPPL